MDQSAHMYHADKQSLTVCEDPGGQGLHSISTPQLTRSKPSAEERQPVYLLLECASTLVTLKGAAAALQQL